MMMEPAASAEARDAVSAVVVGRRVEEPVEQRDVVAGPVRVEAGDRVGQHRVAEPVDGVGELGGDGRVDVGLVERRRARTG